MNRPVIVNPKASAMLSNPSQEPDFFKLLVLRKEEVAQGIYMFELRDPDGTAQAAASPDVRKMAELLGHNSLHEK